MEYWAYYAKDEQTQRFVSYELVFEKSELKRWVVKTDMPTALGSVQWSPERARIIQETLRLGGTGERTDRPVKK